MKRPIEGAAPKPHVVNRVKEAAWDELLEDLLASSAYRSLKNVSTEAAIYQEIRSVLDAVLDYRCKQEGASEQNVAEAERQFRAAHREIPNSEMNQLIGKIEKVANRYIDSGIVRNIEAEVEAAEEMARQELHRREQLAKRAREAIFPSSLPETSRERRHLEKVEAAYARTEKSGSVAAMRPGLKRALIDFMGATCAHERKKLDANAPQTADTIIDAIDTALGRESHRHPRIAERTDSQFARS